MAGAGSGVSVKVRFAEYSLRLLLAMLELCGSVGATPVTQRVFFRARPHLDYLASLVDRLGQWGYLVIFLGAVLESAAFLGLVFPGESLVIVAGFLAAQGLLDIGDLIVVAAIGAIIGDARGYEMARRWGRSGLDR